MSFFDKKDISQAFVPEGQPIKETQGFFDQKDTFQGETTDPTSKIESAGRGLVQGATIGFADEITGAAMALYDLAEQKATTGATADDFSDLYKQYRNLSRQADEKAVRDNPKTSAALDLVGSILTGGALAKQAGKMAATKSGRLFAQGAEAVVEGAVGGAGRSEELNKHDLQKGAFAGGATFGIGQGLGKGMAFAGKKIQNLPSSTHTKAVEYTEEALKLQPSDKNAIYKSMGKFGITGEAADKKYADIMDYLHDQKVVKAGNTVEDIQKKIKVLNENKGLELDSFIADADKKFKINIPANSVIRQSMSDTMNKGYLTSNKMAPSKFGQLDELQGFQQSLKTEGRELSKDALERSKIGLEGTLTRKEINKIVQNHPQLNQLDRDIAESQRILTNYGKKDVNSAYLTRHIDDLNAQKRKVIQNDPELKGLFSSNKDISRALGQTAEVPPSRQVNRQEVKVTKDKADALFDNASPNYKTEVSYLKNTLFPDLQSRFGQDNSLGGLRKMRIYLDDLIRNSNKKDSPLAGKNSVLTSVRDSVNGQIKRELNKINPDLAEKFNQLNSDIHLGLSVANQVKKAAERTPAPMSLGQLSWKTITAITHPWTIPGIILGQTVKEKYGKALLADSFSRLNEMVTKGSLKSLPGYGDLLNNAFITGGIPELTRQHIKLLSTEPKYRSNYKDIYDKYEGEIRDEHNR